MNNILFDLRRELKNSFDENTKNTAKRFFKEKIKVYGVKTALVSRIAEKYFQLIKDLPKNKIFNLCEQLLDSGYMEESFIACNWSYKLADKFEEKDWLTFEKWVKEYVNNWATCDTLCNHTVGAFIEKYSKCLNNLRELAKSKNRWERRASAVSLIIPARKGKFLQDIFAIADMLLTDEDDLVQKGYGWMLKAASQAHQREVFEYIMKNKSEMPRTALRYAIEKMPKELKTKAMKKA